MELQARTAASSEAGSPASAYLPGLDGLRALSVLAVLVYHANVSWLPGGYLGVEIFFVISGFIITRGLAFEWVSTGRIAPVRFWMRRARRLLPALFLLLTGVLAYAALFDQDSLTKLRVDVLYAFGYVTNWHLIFSNQSYFDSWNHPSFLRHLWSLAIEEQFYLLWPLVLFAALKVFSARIALGLIVSGAMASYVAMALLSQGQDEAGISRVYYGTDTRIGALLVGSAVGFLPFSERIQGWTKSRAAGGFGLLALIPLFYFAFELDEHASYLYEGGFAMATLTAAVLIFSLNNSKSIASRILGIGPLRWIGLRSYGIYLYHWPILLLSWPDLHGSMSTLAFQLLATLFIADVSYRFLELPVRRGGLSRTYRSLIERRAGWKQGFAAGFAVAAVGMVGFGLAFVAIAARPPKVPEYLQANSIRIISPALAEDVSSLLTSVSIPQPAEAGEIPPPESIEGALPPGEAPPPAEPEAPALTPEQEAANAQCATIRGRPYESDEERDWFLANCVNRNPPPPLRGNNSGGGAPLPTFVATGTVSVEGGISAIGDSVMVGAGAWLAANFAGIDVDAAVGRQAAQAISLLRQRRDEGALARNVLLHIGNNGPLSASQFDQIMEIAGPERRVFFINVYVPRAWQDSTNRVIAEGAAYYPNAFVIDWYGTINGHDELFAADGVHIASQGASIYTGLVVQAMTQ